MLKLHITRTTLMAALNYNTQEYTNIHIMRTLVRIHNIYVCSHMGIMQVVINDPTILNVTVIRMQAMQHNFKITHKYKTNATSIACTVHDYHQ